MWSASTISLRGPREIIDHLIGQPRFELLRHDVTFLSILRSTKSTTLPVRHHPFITKTIPCRRPRRLSTRAINMLGLAKASEMPNFASLDK